MACATATHTSNEGSGGDGGAVSGEGGSGGEAGSGGAGGAGGGALACVNAEDCLILTGSCFEGTCINGVCTAVAVNDGASCDDGLYCTQADMCSGGLCQISDPASCK